MTLFQRLMASFGITTAPEPDPIAPDVRSTRRPDEFRVGEYIADYSPLSPEEIAAADRDVLEDLYKHSRPVSR